MLDIIAEETGIDFKITGLFKKDLLMYSGEAQASESRWLDAAAESYKIDTPASTTTDTSTASSTETVIDNTL